MKIENCTIITSDNSIFEVSPEELKNVKNNTIIHESRLGSDLAGQLRTLLSADPDAAAAEQCWPSMKQEIIWRGFGH